ncbi:ELAV-like protein 1 [Montipora foliosa]|uniref:ELAV-like protein 1 n=1 Tax=Montipora foliosa TaxID=591990 RepID=UPI0035F1A17E
MAEMSFGTNGITNENEKKNVIVNYIPPDITEVRIREMFSACGSVVGVKLMRDKSGVSLGYAFVNYNSGLEATRAIEAFDGKQMGSKTIRVSYARPSSEEIKNANLYIAGLPKSVKEDDLKTLFSVYGTIISSKILTLESGESRGVGFIRFDRRTEAQAAIDALNGMNLQDNGTPTALAVRFANPPKGPQATLQTPGVTNELTRPALNMGGIGPIRHEAPNHRFSPFGPGLNFRNNVMVRPPNDIQVPFNPSSPHDNQLCPCIFVYGLPTKTEKDTLNELLLYRLFSPHGAILSIHAKEGSAYGFINMIRHDEAVKAVMNLNGYYLQQHNTHLQVSFKKNKPM